MAASVPAAQQELAHQQRQLEQASTRFAKPSSPPPPPAEPRKQSGASSSTHSAESPTYISPSGDANKDEDLAHIVSSMREQKREKRSLFGRFGSKRKAHKDKDAPRGADEGLPMRFTSGSKWCFAAEPAARQRTSESSEVEAGADSPPPQQQQQQQQQHQSQHLQQQQQQQQLQPQQQQQQQPQQHLQLHSAKKQPFFRKASLKKESRGVSLHENYGSEYAERPPPMLISIDTSTFLDKTTLTSPKSPQRWSTANAPDSEAAVAALAAVTTTAAAANDRCSWTAPESWAVQSPEPLPADCASIKDTSLTSKRAPQTLSGNSSAAKATNIDRNKNSFIRISRRDGTFATISCNIHLTCREVCNLLGKKFFISDLTRWNLFVIRNGQERLINFL